MISNCAKECCGCTACEKICIHKAISMKFNEKGFLEPTIDMQKCIGCDLCSKVCPLQSNVDIISESFQQEYYAVKIKNIKKRMQSQSGGAFTILAENILQKKGCVYGVGLNDKLEAVYCRATTYKTLEKLKGSKYVQADLENTYLLVKSDLQAGKWVLFSGTPCHVQGLKNFLRKQGANLIKLVTVDLICHGVPSPGMYKEYKELFSMEHSDKKITSFDFRNKAFGWHGHTVTIGVGNKKFVNNDYVRLFYSHYCLRDCCYECGFASLERLGDITIGDCWGIERSRPEFDDGKGCSLVIINTNKGKSLWNSIETEIEVIQMEKSQILQPNLQHPTEAPETLQQFWSDYKKYGCEYVLRRYCGYDPKQEYELINKTEYFKRLIRKSKWLIDSFFVK